MKKILIIRFSSFGDIVQTRAVLKPLCTSGKVDEVHWLVRKDLLGALKGEKSVHKIISFDRKEGLGGLIKLAIELRVAGYHYVYDAHNNLRSTIVRFIVCALTGTALIVRSKERWKRFLLFKLRIQKLPDPYKAMKSYWAPLKEFFALQAPEYQLTPRPWPIALDQRLEELTKGRIILVPSAAWEMKRWPEDHWKKLIRILSEYQFTILGGPGDDFCEEIKDEAPERVINMAGKLSLHESCTVAGHCEYIITGDTGLQQVADLAGRPGLSLMGPTAFGFVTMGTLKTLGVNLNCRPCSKDGRGKCVQDTYQKCMVDISPEAVAQEVRESLNA